MNDITVQDIINVCNAKLLCGNPNTVITNISRDTRTLCPGDLYVGIKGENFDGNVFCTAALNSGAIGCLTDSDFSDTNKFTDKVILQVENTITALQQLAHYKRKLYNIPVIGITGSVGKTSTKDVIASVVSKKYNVLKTEGNLNNLIGLPLTLLRLKDHTAVVVEMGMGNLGEISTLSKIAEPTMAVITNVGTSHIGNLGSRENILKAKLEILDGLDSNGKLIINTDNDLLNKYFIENTPKNVITYGIETKCKLNPSNVVINEDNSTFDIQLDGKTYTVKIPVAGGHFVYNCLAAICVGLELGIDINDIINGIQEFSLTKSRMEINKLKNNVTVINDAYNASYDSMKAALEYLSTYKSQRKIAILGDMLELGDFSKELHEKVGSVIPKNNIDMLITIGTEAKYIASKACELNYDSKNVFSFDNNVDAIKFIKNNIKENDVILLKASHGMKFSEIYNELNKMTLRKVGVIFGGMSTEHDVSKVSGTSVIKNLDESKYEIYPIYIDESGNWFKYNDPNKNILTINSKITDLERIDDIVGYLKKLDVIFPVLHGLYGEDGTIQGLLELSKVPYVGCKVLGSSVGMDKVYTKAVIEKANITQAKYAYVRKYNDSFIYIDEKFNEQILPLKDIATIIIEKLGLPVFVKPSNSGSSVGINKAKTIDELQNYIKYAAQFDKKVLVEEAINGREIECAVLGNEDVKSSCVGEIIPAEEFYSFDAKYNDSNSLLQIPAKIEEDISNKIRSLAIKAFKAVDGKGLARVDFFVDKVTKEIYFNEINTMPGFTAISMYPKLWEESGLKYAELLDELIDLALE